MDFSAALPTFVITLREGVEAALVVGIVLACLQKAQRADLNRWVFFGIFAGAGGSVLTGLGLNEGLRWASQANPKFEPVIEPLLESGLCLVAIAMLSWMLIWMTQQARSLKADIEGSIADTLQDSAAGLAAGWSVFTLITIAVLREGFETVIFLFTNLQQGAAASGGAIAGLVGAVAIGFALFKWGIRIDLRRFFQVMGTFLLLIVGGLVISALRHVDASLYALGQLNGDSLTVCWANQSCVLGPLFWDTSQVLPDRAFPGVVLKALLGYRDHLYVLQVLGYLVFLITVGGRYFRSLQGKSSRPQEASPSS